MEDLLSGVCGGYGAALAWIACVGHHFNMEFAFDIYFFLCYIQAVIKGYGHNVVNTRNPVPSNLTSILEYNKLLQKSTLFSY
jgi:hypothetical protein